MVTTEYRLFVNNSPLSIEQIDRIEEVVVDQEVDLMWQAHIRISIFVDGKGKFIKEKDQNFIKSLSQIMVSRIRIEVKVGKKSFVPLIDGPVVGINNPSSFKPGQSFIDVIVHDDSSYLNQVDKTRRFEDIQDDQIAAKIFQDCPEILHNNNVEKIKQKRPIPVVIQRGTDMQLLRMLSKRNGMHSYVLPGINPGQSIGCFKPFPTQKDGLPDLVLLGSDHNLVSFKLDNDFLKPSNFNSLYLSMVDKSISEYHCSFNNANKMLTCSSVDCSFNNANKMLTCSSIDNKKNTASSNLSPFQNLSSSDTEQMVKSKTMESSYSNEGTGSVLENCYPDVLQPYRVVCISGACAKESGEYVLTKVTHTLNRESYSQSFTVIRPTSSDGSSSKSDKPMGKVF